LIDRFTINGRVKSANTLLTAVKVMFKATSPLKRWLYRFAVGPPGEAASSIKPTANSGDKPKNSVKPKQIAGSRIN
jgi:hypothetical protein